LSDLIPFDPDSLLPSSTRRQTKRALAELEARAQLATRADALRIERVADKTKRGLVAVAHISAVEAALLPIVPHAERRLQQVADGGALGIARIVMDP
jgi:hypothetical protein